MKVFTKVAVKFSLTLILFFSLSSVSVTKAALINAQSELNLQEYYKQMYEDQKDYNDRILNTVYWALGGLATAIISIVGLNVFNSIRSNKASIEAIKQEVLKYNEEESKQNNIRLVERFDQLKRDSAVEINEYSKQTENSLDERLVNFQNELSQKFNGINLLLAYEISERKSLNKEIQLLEAKVYEFNAEFLEDKGHYLVQLHSLIKAIEILIEQEHSPEGELRKMEKTILKLKSISGILHSDILKVIKKVPEDYSALVLRIENLLSDIVLD